MNPLLELCADVIVSAAARRSILVGCGSAPPVQKFGVGGCAARRWRPKNVFQRFLKKFRSKIAKLPNNKYTAKMASAARRQIIGGGDAPINKIRRRWCPQIVAAARRARTDLPVVRSRIFSSTCKTC